MHDVDIHSFVRYEVVFWISRRPITMSPFGRFRLLSSMKAWESSCHHWSHIAPYIGDHVMGHRGDFVECFEMEDVAPIYGHVKAKTCFCSKPGG